MLVSCSCWFIYMTVPWTQNPTHRIRIKTFLGMAIVGLAGRDSPPPPPSFHAFMEIEWGGEFVGFAFAWGGFFDFGREGNFPNYHEITYREKHPYKTVVLKLYQHKYKWIYVSIKYQQRKRGQLAVLLNCGWLVYSNVSETHYAIMKG